MAPHSSTLAWKLPRTEEPGGVQSRVAKSRTRLSDFTFTFHFPALEKEMATLSSVLAWRSPGTGEPGGLPSVGLHRARHDWSDLAAAAAAALKWFVQGCSEQRWALTKSSVSSASVAIYQFSRFLEHELCVKTQDSLLWCHNPKTDTVFLIMRPLNIARL